jgi:hypothetical protein
LLQKIELLLPTATLLLEDSGIAPAALPATSGGITAKSVGGVCLLVEQSPVGYEEPVHLLQSPDVVLEWGRDICCCRVDLGEILVEERYAIFQALETGEASYVDLDIG